MINSTDLRLGNYIHIDYFHNVDCFAVNDINECEVNSFDLDDILPIPLTEEWLKKFGFIELDSIIGEGYFKEHRGAIGIQINIWAEEPGEETIYRQFVGDNKHQWWVGEPIKYVHELQNRWQSLTREELTIQE